jgi:Ca-activated chloride channel family protein
VLPALRLLAVALLILAMARPQRGEASGTLPSEGIDIVLLLDISSSMTHTAGGGQTKLEAAKAVVKEFIRSRENDRVGLVVFQEETYLGSPLTLDYSALARIVDQMDRDLLPDGTAIGLATMEGLNTLRESEAKSRIMILLTDGQNNQHLVEPEQAAEIAATLNVRVYTIGFAASGPSAGPGASGIDEETLQRMAEVTEAQYYRATDAETLREIYREIGELETSRVERQGFTRYDELAPFLLVPALGLVLMEAALAATALRRAP